MTLLVRELGNGTHHVKGTKTLRENVYFVTITNKKVSPNAQVNLELEPADFEKLLDVIFNRD